MGVDAVPMALARMANTELVFAKEAADTTIHAAFVHYFADESVVSILIPAPPAIGCVSSPTLFRRRCA